MVPGMYYSHVVSRVGLKPWGDTHFAYVGQIRHTLVHRIYSSERYNRLLKNTHSLNNIFSEGGHYLFSDSRRFAHN